jgi:hypothetical protein
MIIADSNPAVVFDSEYPLYFVRANEATGDSWPTTSPISIIDWIFEFSAASTPSGLPAVVYTDSSNKIKFKLASNADGSFWGAETPVDSNNFNHAVDLAFVNGNPAVAYVRSSNLYFIRASNSSGSSWGSPQSLHTNVESTVPVSMAVIDGVPAIAFAVSGANYHLWYKAAANPDGSSWGSSEEVDGTCFSDFYSLAQVNGSKPAISYYDYDNGLLKYAVKN